MVASKETVARRLADSHFAIDRGVRQIFLLVRPDVEEDLPDEPIKLLEVNTDTLPAGIVPVYFGPHFSSGIDYPAVVVDVTPAEFELIRHGKLPLPDGWKLGEELLPSSGNGNGQDADPH